jgi:hypothetical protein
VKLPSHLSTGIADELALKAKIKINKNGNVAQTSRLAILKRVDELANAGEKCRTIEIVGLSRLESRFRMFLATKTS